MITAEQAKRLSEQAERRERAPKKREPVDALERAPKRPFERSPPARSPMPIGRPRRR
jgi:hypothetical protein